MSPHLSPGDTFRRRGQKYRYDGLVDHRTEAGRWVELAEVTTRCAECGDRFSFKTRRSKLQRGPLNRRCDLHKHPGVPVRPKRRKSHGLTAAEQFREKQCRRALAAKNEARAYSHQAMKAEAAAERQRRRAEAAKRIAEQERQRAEAEEAEAAKHRRIADAAERAAEQERRRAQTARAEAEKQQRTIATRWYEEQRRHALQTAQAIRTERREASKRRADAQRQRARSEKLLGAAAAPSSAGVAAAPAWLG